VPLAWSPVSFVSISGVPTLCVRPVAELA
jgi:hypothetical protein